MKPLDENSRVIFVAHGAPNRIEDLAILNGNDLAERLKEVLDLFHKGREKIIKKCSVISCHVANTDMKIIRRSGERTSKINQGFGYDAINAIHDKNITLREGLVVRANTVQVTFIGTHQIKYEEVNLNPEDPREVIVYTRDEVTGDVHYRLKDYREDLLRVENPIVQTLENPSRQDPITLFERNINTGKHPLLLKKNGRVINSLI